MTGMSSPVHLTYFRGRVALREVLRALGLGAGDEVAIQAYTCLAVPLPVLATGARPLFIDIRQDDLGMDPGDLEAKLSERTRAVVVQHTFGMPASMTALHAVAAARGIPVIEDCAHVFGARENGRQVGETGVAAFYSFEWGKPVVAGVGGGLRVNDPGLLEELRQRRASFTAPSLKRRLILEAQYHAYRWLLTGRTYWAVRSLYNRLSALGLLVGTFGETELELSAGEEYGWAMAPRSERRLRRNLAAVEHIIAHHERVGALYDEGLEDLGLPVWPLPDGRHPVRLRYPLRVLDKPEVLAAARRQRVELSGMFDTVVDPLDEEALARIGYEPGSCPVAEEAARSIVSFPVASRVREREVARSLRFIAGQRGLVAHPDSAPGLAPS